MVVYRQIHQRKIFNKESMWMASQQVFCGLIPLEIKKKKSWNAVSPLQGCYNQNNAKHEIDVQWQI